MFKNLSSKFPKTYNCGLNDDELNYANTAITVEDYKNNDKLTKFLINRNTLIQYARKQDSLISPGLDKLRYEHLKVLLCSISSTNSDEIEFGNSLSKILTLISNNNIPNDVFTNITKSRINRNL